MNILVTGGAGYIGSIIAERLLGKGHRVIVLDNLQQGHREAVLPEAEFHLADIRDTQAVEAVFRHAKIEAVMHLAADTVVEYSVTDPERYFQNNVAGGINLLEVMLKYDVSKLIFSSSAAVYGQPRSKRVSEGHSKAPINSYGESKLKFERFLERYGGKYGLKHISLRCFNVAGASEHLGEDHRLETHLIPIVLKAAGDGRGPLAVFGTDYPTRDGSCVRDYVHVVDIAQGHILALEKVEELTGRAYNLGSGKGNSVLDVVATAGRVTRQNIPVRICPRRPGDPAVLVANSRSAKSELGWQPEFPDLEGIIASAWMWTKQHPNGYGH